eukprot:8996051-Lingulodinium_polyedra.AAC.1
MTWCYACEYTSKASQTPQDSALDWEFKIGCYRFAGERGEDQEFIVDLGGLRMARLPFGMTIPAEELGTWSIEANHWGGTAVLVNNASAARFKLQRHFETTTCYMVNTGGGQPAPQPAPAADAARPEDGDASPAQPPAQSA